jgi:hypothetical protein
MKTILTVTLSLLASFTWAQEQLAAIENTEANVLFRGYANKFIINTHPETGSYYSLSGSNTSIFRKSDHYVVKPGNGKKAVLTVSERKEDGTVSVLAKKEFRVKNLPDPSLYWGYTASGKAVDNPKPTLTCEYVDYFQMDVEFHVVSWEAEYIGKTYSGDSTDITPLNNLIATFTELTELTIVAMVQGPDGISRQLDGTWFIRPAVKNDNE